MTARGRLIYGKICNSEQVNRLPDDTARLLFTWLLTRLDAYGRYYGDAQRVRSHVFPCREDLDNGKVEKYLKRMEKLGLIGRWQDARGQRWLFAPMFLLHQSIQPERERASGYPDVPEDVLKATLDISRMSLEEFYLKRREGNRSKGNRKRKKGQRKTHTQVMEQYAKHFCFECNQVKDLCECEEAKDD